jgi:hypothetical protein
VHSWADQRIGRGSPTVPTAAGSSGTQVSRALVRIWKIVYT